MPSSIVLGAIFGDALLAAAALGATGYAIASFAINMVASAIISRAFFNPNQPDASQGPNPGNPQQFAPATDNKLPIVYGTAFVGGIVVDLSISSDYQDMYYVIALSEVTDNGNDVFTFGDMYWGGKKVIFDGTDQTQVIALLDESTNTQDTTINGHMNVYFYRNGSNTPVNSSLTAIQVMQSSGLVYQWDSSKLMTNCAFAIVHLNYSVDAGTTGLQQTKFQLTNPRTKPGDVFLDYMTNSVYGAAIPSAQVDDASLTVLNVYSDESFAYIDANGDPQTQPRFRFDGVVLTSSSCMQNLQMMSACCDCLLKYNEIQGKWGVITQTPAYTVAMALTDSNMVSSIGVSPMDISASYNIVEARFTSGETQDSFDSATFDLAEIAPELLFPNEPVNKTSVNLNLINNSIRAQYIAVRLLKSAREDLQVTVNVNFSGIQLEAGDIVTVTNTNYGWVAKPFRINKIIEDFAQDGSVTAKLTLAEFNASVFDDSSLTQFQPSPNTGLGDPTVFGTVPTPSIVATYPSAPVPSFDVGITASSAGVIQYAEVWYSVYPSPTTEQLIFGGTTEVKPSGNPYSPGSTLPPVNLTLPAGDWYFFTRMNNSLGSSQFSLPSTVFKWRPTTFQYTERWLAVAYADSADGVTGFSLNPRNKTYYGLFNNATANGSANPADYTWYAGNFGTSNYLLIANRTNRKFSFAIGNAGFANLGGAFVPSETSVYDSSIWGALEDGQNYIDLDLRTGQLTKAGTTATSSADGLLSIVNNTSGSMVVSLEKFLNFGNGVYSKTFNAATLTIDVYGRVVGFTQPDDFYYTEVVFSATAGQTTFNETHIVGSILVFQDGALLDPSEYSETTAGIVMNTPCAAGVIVVIINMRAVSTNNYFENLVTNIQSSTSNSIVLVDPTYQTINAGDQLCFAATQPSNLSTPTVYTVQSFNAATKTVTFTGSIAGATAGYGVYRYRAAGSTYAPFSRFSVDLTGATSYTPTDFAFRNGFESIYVNGVQFSEVDYDLSGNTINGFPAPVTGRMTVIMYSENNFGVPASNVTNTVAYSVNGALSYVFPNNPLSMEVYANGMLLTKGSSYDYTATSSGYNLTTAFSNNFTLLNQQTFARIGAA